MSYIKDKIAIKRLKKLEQKREERLEVEYSFYEIAKELNLSVKEVRRAYNSGIKKLTLSLSKHSLYV